MGAIQEPYALPIPPPQAHPFPGTLALPGPPIKSCLACPHPLLPLGCHLCFPNFRGSIRTVREGQGKEEQAQAQPLTWRRGSPSPGATAEASSGTQSPGPERAPPALLALLSQDVDRACPRGHRHAACCSGGWGAGWGNPCPLFALDGGHVSSESMMCAPRWRS